MPITYHTYIYFNCLSYLCRSSTSLFSWPFFLHLPSLYWVLIWGNHRWVLNQVLNYLPCHLNNTIDAVCHILCLCKYSYLALALKENVQTLENNMDCQVQKSLFMMLSLHIQLILARDQKLVLSQTECHDNTGVLKIQMDRWSVSPHKLLF